MKSVLYIVIGPRGQVRKPHNPCQVAKKKKKRPIKQHIHFRSKHEDRRARKVIPYKGHNLLCVVLHVCLEKLHLYMVGNLNH